MQKNSSPTLNQTYPNCIPKNKPLRTTAIWQEELKSTYRSLEALHSADLLNTEQWLDLKTKPYTHAISVPKYYANLIDRNNPNCPIFLQAVPRSTEENPTLPQWAQDWSQKVFHRDTPWHKDPIGDQVHLSAPRLTHRYENRAILHTTSHCALTCRFCFRKIHLSEKSDDLYSGNLEPAIEYLITHPEVEELILTGGDPLTLSDQWFESFFLKLARISSLKQIRIHSRIPVILPSRITHKLTTILSSQHFTTTIVSHFNHPRELTPEAILAQHLLRHSGIHLLNQTVLLKNINNDAKVLYHLFQGLYREGITPFYLHHPDWTPHTFHFRVSIEEGQQLMRELQGKLSGPARPHYVLDIPGGFGKCSLMDQTVKKIEERSDSNFKGALYTVSSPVTRTSKESESRLYFDFWSKNS